MSNAEIKPAGQAETKSVVKEVTKPAGQTETKPVDKAESKPAGKVETRQAGKGSKRRPFKAKQYAANYEAIRWGKAHSRKPGR
jgi:hypothetical protein